METVGWSMVIAGFFYTQLEYRLLDVLRKSFPQDIFPHLSIPELCCHWLNIPSFMTFSTAKYFTLVIYFLTIHFLFPKKKIVSTPMYSKFHTRLINVTLS